MDERKPLMFAQLTLPNRTALRQISSSGSSVTATNIISAMKTGNVTNLRAYSNYFYNTSGEYRRLVEYYSKLFLQEYVLIPRIAPEDYGNKKIDKTIKTIEEYSSKNSIIEDNLEIATSVVREGVYFGYERELATSIMMQPLPSDYCRTRYKINGVYLVEFDMKFFDQFRTEAALTEALSSFPEEFIGLYRQYKASPQDAQWAVLDPLKARCHVMWGGMPLLAPIMLDILDLLEYKELEKAKSEQEIRKILIQKIPVNKDGEITLLMPEITDLHNNFSKMVTSSYTDVLTTPADVDMVEFGSKAQTIVDNTEKASKLIYNAAGTSAALFNSAVSGGSVGLEASIKTDMSLMFPLLKQIETWYNYKFTTLSSKYPFAMNILPVTEHNRDKLYQMYKEAMTFGLPTATFAMATLGIRQYDISYMLAYENNFMQLPDRLIPRSSSYNSGVEDNNNGRPPSEDPLSDEGQKTRDSNKNDNRA